MLAGVFEPCRQVIEGVSSRDVVDKERTSCTAIVRPRDRPVKFNDWMCISFIQSSITFAIITWTPPVRLRAVEYAREKRTRIDAQTEWGTSRNECVRYLCPRFAIWFACRRSLSCEHQTQHQWSDRVRAGSVYRWTVGASTICRRLLKAKQRNEVSPKKKRSLIDSSHENSFYMLSSSMPFPRFLYRNKFQLIYCR